MSTCGIYKITSPNGKIYIGQSINIERRWVGYKKLRCNAQIRLYKSLAKHGVDAHKFEIIHQCNESKLDEMEVYYIELFKCFNTYNGLNLKHGGSHGRHSDKSKQKNRESNLGIHDGKKNQFYGKSHSDDAIKKMKQERKGKQHSLRRVLSDKTKNRISKSILGKTGRSGEFHSQSKFVVNTLTGIFYPTVKEACESYNRGSIAHFHNKLRGIKFNDTPFIYCDDKEETGRKVVLNTATGIFYKSITEAWKSQNLHSLSFFRNQIIGTRVNKTSFIHL